MKLIIEGPLIQAFKYYNININFYYIRNINLYLEYDFKKIFYLIKI